MEAFLDATGGCLESAAFWTSGLRLNSRHCLLSWFTGLALTLRKVEAIGKWASGCLERFSLAAKLSQHSSSGLCVLGFDSVATLD